MKSVFRLSLQLLCGTFLIPNRTERDIIINVHRSSCRVFLSDFNGTWIFVTEFRKTLKYEISWKSVQWEQSCSRRTVRQADMTNLTVAFRNFSKAHTNNCCMLCQKLNRHCFDPPVISKLGTEILHMSIKGILLRVLCLTAICTGHVVPSVRMFQPQKRWGNNYKIPCENFKERKVERFHFYFTWNTLNRKLPYRFTHA